MESYKTTIKRKVCFSGCKTSMSPLEHANESKNIEQTLQFFKKRNVQNLLGLALLGLTIPVKCN